MPLIIPTITLKTNIKIPKGPVIMVFFFFTSRAFLSILVLQ